MPSATPWCRPWFPTSWCGRRNDGGWHVELNTGTLPRVLFDQTYYAKVSKGRRNEKEDAFLADCMQTAKWLVKSLDQRARTILKVATEIVRQQDAFLAHGVQHLRPLNLKTVAEAIGMHELTVSRVTSNKYMATTRGVFELKYFFTAAIASAEGGVSHSAEAVRHRIKRLIDDEPAETILSDDAIVQDAARLRHRYRPANGRQISGGTADPVLGPAPARQAGGALSAVMIDAGEGRPSSGVVSMPFDGRLTCATVVNRRCAHRRAGDAASFG